MTLLTSLLGFAIVISVIVFVHEGGHYLVARLCGVRVEVFSLGFGKELLGFTDRHGTRWKLSLLPLGGYVKMLGDTDPISNPDLKRIEHFSEQEKREAFFLKPLLAKAAIVAAGPITNFIFAIVMITGLYTFVGRPIASPVVTAVIKESPAEAAGIEQGDRVLRVEGEEVRSFSDIQRIISTNSGTEVPVVILRDKEEIKLSITPKMVERDDAFGNKIKMAMIGIQSEAKGYETLPLPEAASEAVRETYKLSAATLKVIGQMITGKRGAEEISGPIRIAKYSGQSLNMGLISLCWFMALISINLGVVNLFPIPTLDGGHLLYYTIEALRGKPMADVVQAWGMRVGIVLVAALAIFATANDIIQLHVFQ